MVVDDDGGVQGKSCNPYEILSLSGSLTCWGSLIIANSSLIFRLSCSDFFFFQYSDCNQDAVSARMGVPDGIIGCR